MSYKPVIEIEQLNKCYHLYSQPQDRLKQMLWRGKKQFFREFWALHDINFSIQAGEVIGIIGKNGSGKSTLLQIICGTLTPTSGKVAVNGRIAALLELGAGFNPEFTGRENISMSAAILGLKESEIKAKLPEIINFSEIEEFIDQPVKTYSSGMYVRLAFSVAINVDPDILVIDEALSVGDGAFSRKSFNKIMQLKDAGKTILFCSHSMYQIEAICNKAIWLNQGKLQAIGNPADIVIDYNNFLSKAPTQTTLSSATATTPSEEKPSSSYFTKIEVSADGKADKELHLISRQSTLKIALEFTTDTNAPTPSIALTIDHINGEHIASSGTLNDNVPLTLSPSGKGLASIEFPNIPLLKGIYTIDIFLLCEQGLHAYQTIKQAAKLIVIQSDLEIGIVSLPHSWSHS